MNTTFHTLTDRITTRLRGDPELRLEVRRELMSHLTSASADHAAAGPADAEAAAMAGLGDPVLLADRLWQTHRRRITCRRIARAAAVLCSWPLALAVLGVMLVVLLRSAAPLTVFSRGPAGAEQASWWPLAMAVHAVDSPNVSVGDALLLPQRPFAMQQDADEMYDAAKAASDAAPGDRALYANYACRAVARSGLIGSAADEKVPTLSGPALEAVLPLLRRGQVLDPDNALYPMWIAQAMARAASVQVRSQLPSYYPYQQHSVSARRLSPSVCWKVKVVDAALFAQAKQIFHRATLLPRLDSYSEELQARRLVQLPAANDIRSEIVRANTSWQSVDWLVWNLDLQATMAAHALDLATAGEAQGADALFDDLTRMQTMTLRAPSSEPSVFRNLNAEMINAHAVAVLRATGRGAEADRLAAAIDRQAAAAVEAYHSKYGGIRTGGRATANEDILTQQLRYVLGGVPPGRALLRRAEYTLFDRAALAWLMVALLGAAGLASLSAGLGFVDGVARPAMLLLPSAGELAWLTLVALVVPLGLYGLFITTTTFGSRAVAFSARDNNAFLEYLVVGMSIVTIAVLVARRRVMARLFRLVPELRTRRESPAVRIAWRCVVRPALLVVGTLWTLSTVELRWLGESSALDRTGVGVIGAVVAWAAFDIVRAFRAAAPSAGGTWWRRPFRVCGAVLLGLGSAAIAWCTWQGGTAFGVAFLLLLTAATGLCAVAVTSAAASRDLAAQCGVRVTATVLRSVSVRLVWLATMAGLTGGAALRWTETRSIEQADRLTASTAIRSAEQNAVIERGRAITLNQLAEQAALFGGPARWSRIDFTLQGLMPKTGQKLTAARR